MNILYKGNYYKRYEPVCKLIKGFRVTELCFGDIIIANYCKKNSIDWNGIDTNFAFVKNSLTKGYKAELNDIHTMDTFPVSDTCIICGSLYHFKDDLENLFSKMLNCSSYLIISEPVINLSNHKGIIGKLAKASATINGHKQQFRFTKQTLTAALDGLSAKFNFNYTVMEQLDKDLIIVINS